MLVSQLERHKDLEAEAVSAAAAAAVRVEEAGGGGGHALGESEREEEELDADALEMCEDEEGHDGNIREDRGEGEEGNGGEDDSEVEEGGREDRGGRKEGSGGKVRRKRGPRLAMSRKRVWRMLAAVGVRAAVSCVAGTRKRVVKRELLRNARPLSAGTSKGQKYKGK
jgi:hypothetical protein